MVMLSATGCHTEKPEPPEPEAQTQKMTLVAMQIESKTYVGTPLDGKIPILWEPNDEIWVRSAAQKDGTPGNRFTTTAQDIMMDGKVAQFNGEALDAGPYVAVYPYSLVTQSSDNRSVVFEVPQSQEYVSGSFGHNANLSAALWERGSRITFSSLAGSLHLQLKGHSELHKIVVSDNDPAFALWGKCTLTISQDGKQIESVVWSNDASNRNELSLDLGKDVTLGTALPSDFYLVVPEGAFAKGLTITMFDAAGNVVNTLVDNNSYSVKSNQMLVVGHEEKPFSKGEGTEADPYQISAPADLQMMAELCNGADYSKYIDKYYVQTSDINMNDVKHKVIGNTSVKAFKGKYDGRGFTISNLAPEADKGKAAGMFGYTTDAEIKNIKIDGYTNTGDNGEQGMIAGRATNSTFSNISINANAHFVKCACGGVVGYMEGGKINDCYVQGFIQNEKYGDFQGVTVVSAVGGIVGYANNAEISNCNVKGNVTAAGEQLGGIAGQVSNCTIDNCKVLDGSTVTGDNYYVGGIAGEMLSGGKITNCEVQAHVVCWYPGAAGIVAWVQSGDISGCVVGSNAQVRTGQDKAGGIVAYIYHKNTAQKVNISDCSVYCEVAAAYSVGGIVGECNPTHDDSEINIWNCAYVGGEIIDAGYHTGKWTMIGGLVAWARMGSSAATLNIVNCFSSPATMRCDFPQGLEVDLGGFIGEQGGANAKVNIQGCYNTLALGRLVINSNQVIDSKYYQYGALIGNPTKTNMQDVFYLSSLRPFGKENSGEQQRVMSLSNRHMTDGTMLGYLNGFQASYTGPLTLKKWVASASGLPVLEGMIANPSMGKQKALRVSLIGDSLSTFDGYAPHGYQGSRAPNGYRCHYPTGDGNVTSASQTYWYILTYDLLKNAVWDTNLAFSGTATTRCTNTSYSDKYWYGQDFCTRYIENGGMGSPDIIIINGGANDWAHGIYNILGNQKLVRYPTVTPHRPDDTAMNAAYAVADACKTLEEAKALPDATFIEAYLKLIRMMTLQYPHVKIIVLIHDTLTPDVEESLLHIADHYDNCRAVDLYAVNGFNDLGWNFEYLEKGYQPNMPKHDFNWNNVVKTGDLRQNCSDHYSAVAMKFIANKIYNELGSWLESSADYNESNGGSINNFDNINGQW
ncbi:MAG: hypothetical protein J6O51_10205 [Bacteroidales bacterium]|nr:hypothetical protein [Bacteroidales bacterium]